jgi:ecotin
MSLIRYNSRLPLVVYAPEGVEVRYRIWTAAPEMKEIEKG